MMSDAGSASGTSPPRDQKRSQVFEVLDSDEDGEHVAKKKDGELVSLQSASQRFNTQPLSRPSS